MMPISAPDTVELCVRETNRSLSLDLIHRMAPDGRIYCTRSTVLNMLVIPALYSKFAAPSGGRA